MSLLPDHGGASGALLAAIKSEQLYDEKWTEEEDSDDALLSAALMLGTPPSQNTLDLEGGGLASWQLAPRCPPLPPAAPLLPAADTSLHQYGWVPVEAKPEAGGRLASFGRLPAGVHAAAAATLVPASPAGAELEPDAPLAPRSSKQAALLKRPWMIEEGDEEQAAASPRRAKRQRKGTPERASTGVQETPAAEERLAVLPSPLSPAPETQPASQPRQRGAGAKAVGGGKKKGSGAKKGSAATPATAGRKIAKPAASKKAAATKAAPAKKAAAPAPKKAAAAAAGKADKKRASGARKAGGAPRKQRACTGRPQGRRKGGMGVSPAELFLYHLDLLPARGGATGKQVLTSKYVTRTDSMAVKVQAFLRRLAPRLRDADLLRPSSKRRKEAPKTGAGAIQLDGARLLAEGLRTFAAFEAAYLLPADAAPSAPRSSGAAKGSSGAAAKPAAAKKKGGGRR